jgi:hypothetical protein
MACSKYTRSQRSKRGTPDCGRRSAIFAAPESVAGDSPASADVAGDACTELAGLSEEAVSDELPQAARKRLDATPATARASQDLDLRC